MWATDIAATVGGRLLGENRNISRIKPLMDAEAEDLSFVIWPKEIRKAKKSRAGCLVAELSVASEYADQFECSLIVVESLFEAFLNHKKLNDGDGLFSRLEIENPTRLISENASIHETAVVLDARVGPGAVIGAHVFIGNGCRIGDNTRIEAGAKIFDGVSFGDGCSLGANSVVGSEGFIPWGLTPSKLLPSLGKVRIGDFVHIGALCTVDRGLIGDTVIENYALLDNMIHVGHDVILGENVVVAAQSGFAGFVHVEKDVTIGGQVGVTPHVRIGEGARISGKSMVHCDIKPYEIWSGNPSVPHATYLRAYGELMNTRKPRRDGKHC